MTLPGMDAAGAVLAAGVGKLWPGAVAAVGVGARVERRWVLGAAQDCGGAYRPMAADTVFDLASLTKVLATTPAVLLAGELSLDDPVCRYVPGVDPRVLVRHLLTHTSGLPPHVLLSATSADSLVVAAADIEPETPPGTRVAYSDLGFILLGGVVSAVTGSSLGVAVDDLVTGPLGVGLRFRPPPSWGSRIAATEVYDGVATVGVVHDENARLAGGVAGHAGLFGTLDDVLGCLPLWFPGGPLLSAAERDDALRDHTAGLGGARGLGWTCRGDRHDILSPGWGPAAVSHTGFTGTSIALDPVTRRWAVLLTNQVHHGRGRPEVFAARRRFHALLVGD